MSAPRGALRTDPHSHHDVPRTRDPVWAPPLMLCESDGTLTDLGALFYACGHYRKRYVEERTEEAYADLGEARLALGGLYWWCIAVKCGLAP